jgi:hypothetical protein
VGILTTNMMLHLADVIVPTATAVASAASAGETAEQGTSPWVIVGLTLLGSSVIAGLVTTVLGNLRAAATARREGYARAVKSLIARSEYPYRVRRRTSDEPEVLAALVERGHDLQEQIAACRTWVTSEHHALGALFEQALSRIDAEAGPFTSQAWKSDPIATAAGMNLNGWGPGDQWPSLLALERAIAYRFGWRRLLPSRFWIRKVSTELVSK